MNNLVFEFRYLAQIVTECQLYAATGRLVCQNGPKRAELYYYLGRIVHAISESAGRSGQPVLSELLRWQEGEIYFEPGVTAPKDDLTFSQSQIFLLALTIYQEVGTLEKSVWVYPTPISTPDGAPGTGPYPLKLELTAKPLKLQGVLADDSKANFVQLEVEPILHEVGKSEATPTPDLSVTPSVTTEPDLSATEFETAAVHIVPSPSELVLGEAFNLDQEVEFSFGEDADIGIDVGQETQAGANQLTLADNSGTFQEAEFTFGENPAVEQIALVADTLPAVTQSALTVIKESNFAQEADATSPESLETLLAKLEVSETPFLKEVSFEPEISPDRSSLAQRQEFSFDFDATDLNHHEPIIGVDTTVKSFEDDQPTAYSTTAESDLHLVRELAPAEVPTFETNQLYPEKDTFLDELQHIPEPTLPTDSQESQEELVFEGGFADRFKWFDNGQVAPELNGTSGQGQEIKFDFESAETYRRLDSVGFAFEPKIPYAMIALIELVSSEGQGNVAYTSPFSEPASAVAIADEIELPLKNTLKATTPIAKEKTKVHLAEAVPEKLLHTNNVKLDWNGLFENFPLFNPVTFHIQPPDDLLVVTDQLPDDVYSVLRQGLLSPNQSRPLKDFELAQACLPPSRLTSLNRDNLNDPEMDLSWLLSRVASIEVNGFLVIDNRNGSPPYYARLFFLEGELVGALFDDGDQVLENEPALKQLRMVSSPTLAHLVMGRVDSNFLRAYFGLYVPSPPGLKGLLCQKMNVKERLNWLASNRFTGVLHFYNANQEIFYVMHEGRELGSYEIVEEFLVKSNALLDYILAEPETYIDLHPARIKRPLSGFPVTTLQDLSLA